MSSDESHSAVGAARTYEFQGDVYRRASTHQKEWGARIIGELDLHGDERILDLGCGDGTLTAQLADAAPEGSVLGVDAPVGMIETARTLERPNLAFRLMDVVEMDFEDEFDVVFSNATLHWVRDHGKALDAVYKALRSDGVLRIQFAASGNCAHFFAVTREVIAQREFARYFEDFAWPWYMPDLDEYRVLLGQWPFRESRVWGENADRHFPDPDAMTAWIDQPSIVPFLANVPEAKRQCFRDTVVARMIGATRQEDGTCFETFRRINVFARK